jgi:hypothetical protein
MKNVKRKENKMKRKQKRKRKEKRLAGFGTLVRVPPHPVLMPP